jgi:tape measure domain-containing protein
MATDQERLLVALEARIRDFERNMAKAASTGDKSFSRIENRAKVSASRVQSSFAKVGLGVNKAFGNFGGGLLSGIVAGFSADKLKDLLDASTQITNALKVAGLSGDELNTVYQKLYESAQKNAAPLDSLVTLYSRVASSQKELGVSTDQVLTLTDNVAKSIRLTGGSAQEASGALLQLSQALGGGKIQAEEYNSLIDGLRPLLQAAAAGMKQAGGSVAKLTQLVKNGEVSSRAFFDAINAGAPTLDQKLAGATLTVSQGFTQVYNSLLDAAKKFNETTETSQMLGTALGDLSTTIDKFSVDNAVNEFAKFINGANDAIAAVNNFAYALGQKVGLDNVGRWFAGTKVGQMLGAHTLDSPEGRMGGVTPVVPPYLRQWIDKNYGDKAGDTKPPATPPTIKPIDITRPEYKPMPTLPGGKGRGGASQSDLEREIAQVTKRTSALDAETAAQAQINPLLNDYGQAAETARAKQELLNAAQQAGVTVTPALASKIDALAASYGSAHANAEKLADAQEDVRRSAQENLDAARGVLKGVVDDLRAGKSAGDILADAISKIADRIEDQLLDAIFNAKGAGGGNIFGSLFSWLGGLFGFSGGGPVSADPWAGLRLAGGGDVRGAGTSTSDSIPAMLSDGEFVVNAKAARKHRALLAAINSGKIPAYAHGGSVGGGNVTKIAPAANNNSPSVTIAPTINLTSNGGTPEQNADLARQTSKAVEGSIRQIVSQELRQAMRPGNLLNNPAL